MIHRGFAVFLATLRLRVNVIFPEQGCKILSILSALCDLICRFLIIDQNGCYLQFRIIGANLILLLCVVICHIRFIHRTFRCNGIIHQGIQIRGLHQGHKLFLIYLHLLQRIRIHCGKELLCRRCRFLLLVIRQRNIMRRGIFLRRKHTLQCADGALLHQLIRRLPIKIQIPDILSRRRNKALRCGIKVNHIFIFRNIVIVNFQHNRIRCSAAATGCQRKHPCQQKPKQTFSSLFHSAPSLRIDIGFFIIQIFSQSFNASKHFLISSSGFSPSPLAGLMVRYGFAPAVKRYLPFSFASSCISFCGSILGCG